MIGAGESCITFHNHNTHKEDMLERRLFLLGDENFAPDNKLARCKHRSTVNLIEFH